MANTTVANLANIINVQFLDALFMKNVANNALVQSGLMVTDAGLQNALRGQGLTIKVDRLNDLTGDEEALVEGTASTPGNITGLSEIAVRLIRTKSFGATMIAQALSAKDPIGFIISRISEYQVGQTEKTLINVLKGVFAISGFTSNTHDISALSGTNALISNTAILDASQKLGDAKDKLVAIAMHSATKTYLQKLNLIATIRPSDGSDFDAYGKMRVIVDDSLPTAAGVYSTFLFAPGAVAYAEADPACYNSGYFAVEPFRDTLKSEDAVMTRRNYLVHPYGFKFVGTVANGTTPANTELVKGTNWEAVYTDAKQYGIVMLKHKIA